MKKLPAILLFKGTAAGFATVVFTTVVLADDVVFLVVCEYNIEENKQLYKIIKSFIKNI
jgi:hypothetical protein